MQNKDSQVITVPEGKIRDYIDHTFRNDTPEEYVRQNIEKRLVNEHSFPKNLIKIEFSIKQASASKRVDIALFPKDTTDFDQKNIYLIVECKKETIPSTDKKEGVEQLKTYMAVCPNCEWGMWTNGKEKEVFRKIKNQKGNWDYEDYNDIPSYGADIEEIDRPKRDTQKKAIGDNLLFAFKKCHNHIYVNEGMQKQPAFFELLKMIFCKIEDERNILEDIQFYVTSKERNNPDGQLTVKNRIDRIFNKVKAKYQKIFEANDKIALNPRTIANIVGEIQKYSLLDTNIDVKGKAYEEIVGANLRGDRGEFFTPRNVMKMAVAMVAPQPGENILDSSCGTGGFLVNAMNLVIEKIEKKAENQFGKEKKRWNDSEKQTVRSKIAEVAGNNFFGFDINPDLVKATKMNMVMNNDGSGNILRENSLLPPHEWSVDFKEAISKALNINLKELTNHNRIGYFDVIVTNPPFGSKIPITDRTILNQFDISRNSNSMPPEQLFIERCVQFLKPKGRLAIVLPDSILGAPGLVHIRKWLLKYTRIIASIDLHADTFQPSTGVQTSILIVQKKTIEETNEPEYNYPIFMAMIERIGHDKRGNPIYKRDKDGEILYFKRTRILENGDIEEYEELELDDQTILVPDVFTNWKKEEGLSW
ncbi:MAG: type I restriction-modification system methyltransferase subunit [Bacteroidetes bacterium]|nr:MAG: type I restriction-modification system methyltransferase subunit [Bacteroidota bacterium]